MSAQRSDALCREIARALPDRPFGLEFWDGGRVLPSNGAAPTIRFRSPDAIASVLAAPGEVGLGRAYVRGEIDVDDLDGVLALLGRWVPPPLSLATKARLLAAGVRATGIRKPPPPPAAELKPPRRMHTLRRDSEAVRHHYDVSNDFFRLFLDPTMTYSCALFEEGTETLEEAQGAKLELICTKLDLQPGQRVLDIGCGWGSFSIHAAREHGVEVVGVTVSPPQAELARQRVRDAGLEDRVEIRVQDYREIPDRDFDAVVSIGMVEHVGEQNIDEYAAVISRVLAPGGKVLNHGIVHLSWLNGKGYGGGEFSRRYVFPDGELLNLSRTLAAFEASGFETLHVEDLHMDYAETLRHWTQNFDENLEEAERVVGPERTRVWRLYLRTARNGFETGQIAVYQVLCSRHLTEPAASHPTGERHGEARRRVPTAAA